MNWKRAGRTTGLSILAFACLASNIDTGGLARAASEPTAYLTSHMQARASLTDFLTHVWHKKNQTYQSAALQIALPGRAGVIWVTPDLQIGTNSTSSSLVGDHQGTRITFDVADIRDWSFQAPGGRLYGHFALRAKLSRLTEQQISNISLALTRKPTPNDWKTSYLPG